MNILLDYLLRKTSILRPLIICFIFSGFIFSIYGNHWYVDRDASSPTHNGRTWVTAWTNMDSVWTGTHGVNWHIVGSGDTIYVSGGTDSTVYPGGQYIRSSAPFPSFNLQVVVCPGKDVGHNGKVYFINTDSTQRCFSVSFLSGVKITGFTFMRNFPGDCSSNPSGMMLFVMEEDSLVTIDNCELYSVNGQGPCVNLWGSKQTINNCLLYGTPNTSPHDQDPIGGGTGRGGYTITNNRIFYNPRSSGNATPGHRDLIQLNYFGSDDNLLTTIANNIMIMDAPYSEAVNSGIYSTTRDANNRFLIYNNIIVMNSRVSSAPLNIYNDGAGHTSFRVFNNTIISWGVLDVNLSDFDTLIFKNNICLRDSDKTETGHYIFESAIGSGNGDVIDINYNYYNLVSGNSVMRFLEPVGETSKDWTWWHSNYEINSDTGTVIFANLWDTLATGYYTEQGRDLGTDESAYFTTDILGNSRPQGSGWDMGALENFQGGGNNPPNQPQNPSPTNGSINQPINLNLSWNCSDPNGDPLTYDVYFGTSSNPSLVAGNITTINFNPGQLDYSTTYYWKIVAKDNHGATTAGPLWNFTTGLEDPVDVIPPQMNGVQIPEADKVILDFSEPLDTASALNISNYNISNQIQVTGVEIYPSHSRIQLNTTNHDSNFVYSISVNNVTDTAGNIISSQANFAFYKLLNIASMSYNEYLIDQVTASSTSDTNTYAFKTFDGLGMGDPDPNSRWASQPMPQWIQYDLGSVQTINLIAISFYRWDQGRIYQYSIETSDDLNQWNEVISNANSSSQKWTMNEFDSLESRYVRIVCLSSNQSNSAGVWETHILGPDSTTPVEFTLFTAEENNGNVDINWITSTETNNHQFLVEKRKGDGNFLIIGSVPGSGTTTKPHSYTFTDNNVSTGSYFYRIKQVDFNGSYTYSNIINIKVVWPTTFELKQNYPNPFNPSSKISYSVPKESFVTLKVYDILGNEITTLVNEKKPTGYYDVVFNASNLSSGIYIYRMQSSDFVQTRKMILLK